MKRGRIGTAWLIGFALVVCALLLPGLVSAQTATATATATSTPTPTATSTPTPITSTDDYRTQATGKGGSPYDHSALITASDFNELVHVSRGVLISVDGALKVDTLGGETIVYPSGTFLVKTIYPLRVRRIYSTSTTATGIVVFW